MAIRRRAGALASLYRDLLARTRPLALVTSHVDYDQWGLAAEAARAAAIPVVHVQASGGLKAYAAFPDDPDGFGKMRPQVTSEVALIFERQVWSRRDQLRAAADLAAWRSKGNLGRPIWWRTGAGASADLVNAVERRQVREVAMRRLRLDPAKPVVVVFNHGVSDAIGTNVEAFADLADWFEQTVGYAASETRVSWLLLDHPHQHLYDRTGFMGRIAERNAGLDHMYFGNSLDVSKNLLWSLIDLGVTVRGSVSNELPAYGIPVLQAGWSEWSGCGLSQVASDQTTYWRLLGEDIAAAVAGESIITDDQVLRARLWTWFYRSATDVITPLVPHWLEGGGNDMMRALRTRMQQVEPDGDPVYAAMHRLWTRRDPVLTRFDLTCDASWAGAVLPAGSHRG